MTCNSCKNKELNKRVDEVDDINKILSIEFIDQHDLETVTYLYRMGYRLSEDD